PAPAEQADPAPAKDGRAERLAELKAKEVELAAALEQHEKAMEELVARQEQERAALGDFSSARSYYRNLVAEARGLRANVQILEERLAKVERAAAGSIHPQLVALRKAKENTESALDDAVSLRKVAQAEAGVGRVDEAPVAKDLRALREVREAWVDATPAARAKTPPGSAKSEINQKFRTWLKADPLRFAVTEQALRQPAAGTGQTIDKYDFTALGFFLLLQFLEDDLDRKNIEVERKELQETRAKVEALEAERDRIEAQLRALEEQEGGDEARAYEDLRRQLAHQRKMEERVAERVAFYRDTLKQDTETRERHAKEAAEAETRLDQAKEELLATRRAIRELKRG
ncbi:MAG: hypothetical protein ACREID_03285, partial [Planctomycetota bacterium]